MYWIVLKYVTKAYTSAVSLWTWFWSWWEDETLNEPHKQFFLSKEVVNFNPTYTTVPEGAIYVEEWKQKGDTLLRVRYSGENIPRVWFYNPFEDTVKQPWVYVGNKKTETDLTTTFNRFLVVGNEIRQELVDHLIPEKDAELIYIAPRTFEELKFPGEGIRIQHDRNSL